MYFFTLFQIPLWHNSSGQLFLQNSCCFLFFQNSHFFAGTIFVRIVSFSGAKVLQSRHFLRIGSSLRQLYFSEELFRIKIFQSRLFWTASLFQKSYILKKLIFQKINFRITYFFWRAALEQLLFQKTLPSIAATLHIVLTTTVCQKSYYLTATVPFHSYTFHLFVSN